MELKEIINDEGEKFEIFSSQDEKKRKKILKNSIEVQAFIRSIYNDVNVLKLLCSNLETLSLFNKFMLPILFSIKRESDEDIELPFDLIDIKEITKAEITLTKIIDFIRPELETIMELFASYEEIHKSSPEIKEKIQLNNTNNQQIHKTLEEEILKKITERATREGSKVKKILFKEAAIDEIIPISISLLNLYKTKFLQYAIKHKSKAMEETGLNSIVFENTLDSLHIKYNVIKPLLSLYWCEHKLHEHYSFITIGLSKKPIVKCPLCNNELSIATSYYFIPPISHLLRDSEGLIKHICLYLVDKTGFKWNSSVYLKDVKNDTEKDIVIEVKEKNYIIIEIKNFSTTVTDRVKKEQIKNHLNQLLKHFKSFADKKIIVSDIILVTNHMIDERLSKIYDELLEQEKYKELLDRVWNLIGINGLSSFEEDLKELERNHIA